MEKIKKNYRFAAGIQEGNVTYFSNIEYNSLYAWTNGNDFPEFLGFFPEENNLKMMLHKQCLKVNEFLLFIPETSLHIHVFSLRTKSFSIVSEKEKGVPNSYSEALLVGNEVWIFPTNISNPIKVIDINTWKIINKICIGHNIKDELEDKTISRLSMQRNIIYISFSEEQRVVCLDTETKATKIICVGTNENFGVFKNDNGFWSISLNTNSIVWTSNDGTENVLELPYEDIQNRYFNNMVTHKNKIIFIPAFCHYFVIYNTDNNQLKILYDDNHNVINTKVPRYFKYDLKNDILSIYPFNSDMWVKIDLLTDTIIFESVQADVVDFNIFPYSEIYKASLVHESGMYALEDFLKYIVGKI